MYFAKLSSRDVDPDLFVNRSVEVDSLEKSLEAYLDATDARFGRAFLVTGGKGSGKTIFARHVLRRLRAKYAAKTLFVEVDCRRCPGSREVFNSAAQAIVDELGKLKSAGAPIKDELIATAQLLNTITRFSDVELKEIHEHVIQFKAAVGLSSQVALLKNLNANFGISLDRSDKQIKSLVGSIRFDEYRLCAALRDCFQDIRDQGFNIVLFVDNIDELHHDYRDQSQRDRVRQQAEWVMELKQAPIAMIACMRTYFADIARDIEDKLTLAPIPGNVLVGILERRLKRESPAIQAACQQPDVKGVMDKLAGMNLTPLAYLEWFKFLCQQEAFDKPRRIKAFESFVRAAYAGIPVDVIESVVRAFPKADREIDRAVLLAACGGEADMAAVQDRQVVLPNDFWNPLRFTLDPALHVLHAGAW